MQGEDGQCVGRVGDQLLQLDVRLFCPYLGRQPGESALDGHVSDVRKQHATASSWAWVWSPHSVFQNSGWASADAVDRHGGCSQTPVFPELMNPWPVSSGHELSANAGFDTSLAEILYLMSLF